MRLENKSFRPKSRLECGLTKQSMLTADEHGTNDMIRNDMIYKCLFTLSHSDNDRNTFVYTTFSDGVHRISWCCYRPVQMDPLFPTLYSRAGQG